MKRTEMLDRVRSREQPWDIVVIGGGATGAGCALDAAARGYGALLVEQHDFGKGTSSRSTKLIHGGVRYLAQGNLRLVRESLTERARLLQNAPHVVHRQEFVVPCYSLWEKLHYGMGLKMYDQLAGDMGIGRSRALSKSETLVRLPTVNASGLAGGIAYFDAQFDDTRLLIDILSTATRYEATVLNYARVTGFLRNDDGSIAGVEIIDAETGESLSASAHAVINASGAFCDPLRKMADPGARPRITFSQGIHLVLDRSFLPSEAAVMIPKTSDGRVLFCIPWHGYTLVGTTDTSVANAELEPAALGAEIDFVLETAAGYLDKKPTRADIQSVFAGIRPLIARRPAARTASLSRGHDLVVDPSGLVTITGGKWTTYRRMAEDAVDKAAEIGQLGEHGCRTRNLLIKPPHSEAGHDAGPLHPALHYTKNDVLRAIRDEMARTVEDVLARRTRGLFLNVAAALEIAPDVANMIAEEHGKNRAWVVEQIKSFGQTAEYYLPPR
ncbi:MAG TPA: glycerol-3-phosphate dehydrogenase/oxidase [Pyrinomonadaceae bacterium]|nr:glycerol-3-phosphate dehydrogenase/oxidase [Pyrinomonadaceae bacterium]